MQAVNDHDSIRLLTFFTGSEGYAADISMVTNILEIPEITFVPMLPEYIKGIINMRGKAVPVFDLALRFSGKADEYDSHSCVIVFAVRGSNVGFLVKDVGDVIDVLPEQISGTPDRKSFVSAIVTAEENVYYKLIRPEEIVEE